MTVATPSIATTANPQATWAIAVLSMLHEPAGANAATRRFRDAPTLAWTLDRLSRCERLQSVHVLCWDDQAAAVARAAEGRGATVSARGPRGAVPDVDAVAAARRWSDGWRGGPLGACEFDRGFHALWTVELLNAAAADAVVLVDPSAGLVDPALIDALVARAAERPDAGYVFAPAAPGLCGVLLRANTVRALAAGRMHPGRLLTYHPSNPVRDPLSDPTCLPIPAPIARTTRRFTLDSARQVARLSADTATLNGELIGTGAEAIVALATGDDAGAAPCELVLELTTRRATAPTFWPGRHAIAQRPDLSPDAASALFDELANVDDLRLALAGVGDPLLHPSFAAIVWAAKSAGIPAVSVETDLLPDDPSVLDDLATVGVDVVAFHLPAVRPETYAAVMGADRMADVLRNLKRLIVARTAGGSRVPLLVPTFVRCGANAAEAEAWYDQWTATLDGAVLRGATACGGLAGDVGSADLSPPARGPCRRIRSRLTVLSDGRATTCEEDAAGAQSIGRIGERPIGELWRDALRPVRDDHRLALYDRHPTCAACREWHRP